MEPTFLGIEKIITITLNEKTTNLKSKTFYFDSYIYYHRKSYLWSNDQRITSK